MRHWLSIPAWCSCGGRFLWAPCPIWGWMASCSRCGVSADGLLQRPAPPPEELVLVEEAQPLPVAA